MCVLGGWGGGGGGVRRADWHSALICLSEERAV